MSLVHPLPCTDTTWCGTPSLSSSARMTPTAWLIAAEMVADDSVVPPGSLDRPKSTKPSLANVSTSAWYTASVPVGYFVLSGVVVLSEGSPVASTSPDVTCPIIDTSLRSVTSTYTPAFLPMAWITPVIGVLYCAGLVSQLTTVVLLSMPSDMRTKLGFQPLTRPETMVSSV